MPHVGRRTKNKMMVMTTDRKSQSGPNHSYLVLMEEIGSYVRKS